MDSPFQSPKEEFWNALTHGVGLIASIGALVGMTFLALPLGNTWHTFGAIVYAITLVTLYASSTLYHSCRTPSQKRFWRTVDHCAIYLLIAGTYTPVTLVGLRGDIGWTLFGVIWALALIGIVYKVFWLGKFPLLSTLAYVGMGWLVVIAIHPLLERLPSESLVWLAAGGLAYMVGVLFFQSRKIPYAHAIWHIFVLLGSMAHYIAIVWHILPAASSS